MIAPADICAGVGERPTRILAGNSAGPTGECPVCRRTVVIGRRTGLVGKHKRRDIKPPSTLEAALLKQCEYVGLPEPEREYRFHPERDWRFDLAWPAAKVAAEVQGAVWTGGRHGRGVGMETDHSKLNAAQLAGWMVLQYSRRPIDDGVAVIQIEEALRGRR